MRRDELIGRTIANRFLIRSVLGEGGMATVFVAEQSAEPHQVALKILRPELHADKTFAKRFDREARAAARVQHPNSVTILASGVEGDLSYIAMELIRGDDLYTLLERHRVLSPRTAVTILAEVCDALAVAHGLGIVHRDLKPENIMVVRGPPAADDGTGPKSVPLPAGSRVKVLDFGIAKLLDKQADAPRPPTDRLDPPSQQTAFTRAGTLIGTPAYMSPEQCALLPVDTRSDIYSCGVLLFQMVTGRLPFEGPTQLHIATKHIHQDPPSLREILPQASAALDALILKTLAKKAADRHPSARNLGGALRKLLPELPDVAYSEGQPAESLPAAAGDATPLSADRPARSGAGSDIIASARTVVAEGLSGPPPSVLVHGPEVRKPIAILGRHPLGSGPLGAAPSAAPAPAAPPAAGAEPRPKPLAVLARHPVEPEGDTLPGPEEERAAPATSAAATPRAPGVESEPEDLARTLVRGPPSEGLPMDLMKTAEAFVPPAPARQLTMQSATSPAPAAQAIGPRAPHVVVVEAPTPVSTAPTPAVPIGPPAVALSVQAAAAPVATAPPQPHAAAPAVAFVPAKAPVPVMPSASVILAPSLAGPPAAAPVIAPPVAAMLAPVSAVHPSQAPALSFGLPPQTAPAAVRESPVVGRALWLGILIGLLTSAILFVLVYVLFLSR